MKKRLKKIVNTVKKSIAKQRARVARKRDLRVARILEIINGNECYTQRIYKIKEKTLESMPITPIYGINESGVMNMYSPELYMYKFKDAEINTYGEWIAFEKEVIWNKFFLQQFPIINPCDEGVLKYENGKLWLKSTNEIIEVNNGYSLGGVHSTHYGHFSLQFFPKLYEVTRILRELNDGEKLTILVPEYKDEQIREIVFSYLKKLDNIEIREVGNKQNIKCKTLFYMDNASYIMESSDYANRAAWNLTTYTANAIKKLLLVDIQKYDEVESRKIYLDRPQGMLRRLRNGEEVRDYFVEQGFEVVSGLEKFSLERKIRLFRNASVIVGPEGTAFMNVIFCRPLTKIVKFTSFYTADCEYMNCFYDKHFGTRTMNICSFEKGAGTHTSYEIPLDRIVRAYKEFVG